MHISVLTLFPDMFAGPFDLSIIKRAKEKGAVTIELINIRDFSTDQYKSVDDHPYGGGQGMILRVDVVDRAVSSIKNPGRIILLDPRGLPFSQSKARTLSTEKHITLLCGHYEGIDERIRSLVHETISIGDFVTTGGELPAMLVVDSIIRLIPGVLKNEQASHDESFTDGALEYPQYTRPETYKDASVPPVLLGGNHSLIEAWKKEQSREVTKKHRPDLLNP